MSSSTTVTMKVDLSCCNECVLRMKKLLKKLNGVESSSIDIKKGLVIVSGHIDNPDDVIEKIRKKVKPATLFSIQSDDDYVSESEPYTVGSTSSHRKNNNGRDSGECSRKGGSDDGDLKCKAHGGRGRDEQPQAKRVHFADEKNSKCDSGECSGTKSNGADDDRSYRAHGGQGKVHHGYESERLRNEEGISDQHCCCCRGKQCHAEEPERVVRFEDVHNFCPNQDFESVHMVYPNQDFDSVHYGYRHSAETMGHYNGWNHRQQYHNCPTDFGNMHYMDDTPTGCWIM